MSAIRPDVELIDEALLSLFKSIWRYRGCVGVQEPGEDKIRYELRLLTESHHIHEAINVCLEFRNARAHYEYQRINFEELAGAISTLHIWLITSSSYSSDTKDSIMARMAISLCIHHSKTGKKRHSSESSTSPSDVLQTACDSSTEGTQNNVVCLAEGTLKDLRGTHKDEMKGARIIILDGKHTNISAVFCCWNGTVAQVILDGGSGDKIVIKLNKRVRVTKWGKCSNEEVRMSDSI